VSAGSIHPAAIQLARFDGEYQTGNGGHVCSISGSTLTWADGYTSTITVIGPMEFEAKAASGQVLKAMLLADGDLHWSNGSVWQRRISTTTPHATANTSLTTHRPFRAVLPNVSNHTIQATELTAPVQLGSLSLLVVSVVGFSVGENVVIDAGTAEEEVHGISGFGSMLLSTPLRFAHLKGAPITAYIPVEAESAEQIEEDPEEDPKEEEQDESDTGLFGKAGIKLEWNLPMFHLTVILGLAFLLCACCCILIVIMAVLGKCTKQSSRGFTPRTTPLEEAHEDEEEDNEKAKQPPNVEAPKQEQKEQLLNSHERSSFADSKEVVDDPEKQELVCSSDVAPVMYVAPGPLGPGTIWVQSANVW
jgi:hypothetical protein